MAKTNNTKTLVPAKGRLVPMDDGTDWPTEEVGKDEEKTTKMVPQEVTMNRFYRRLLKCGDLIDVNAKDDADTNKADGADGKAGEDADKEPNGGTAGTTGKNNRGKK